MVGELEIINIMKNIDNDKNIAQIDIKVYWKDGYVENWSFIGSVMKFKVWKIIKSLFRKRV